MTEQEIVKHINDGAKHYIRMFAHAEHMETYEKEYYSYIKPKEGEHGIGFVYDIKIENLSKEKQQKLVEEIKELQMPIWLDLDASDDVFQMVFGREKVHGQTMFAEEDEIYMAVSAEEWLTLKASHDKQGIKQSVEVIKVNSAEKFAIWAKINNDVLAGGYADLHSVYNYPLCEKGLLNCYIAYSGNEPVAIASIMNNEGVSSLEFVATVPKMRQKGFAKAACERAVEEAFTDGAKIITVRAANLSAGKLYEKIGFKAYNYVI